MSNTTMQKGDGFLIVDMQNDFCAGGALAVPQGDNAVNVLNRWIQAAVREGVPVYASRDWHPKNHVSFTQRGGPWPPHCVQGTHGAQFHPELKLPPNTEIISKGTDPDQDSYSAFGGTDLAQRLSAAGIRRLWVGGLAQDYCVKATVVDASRLGIEVHLIAGATRPVNVQPLDGAHALEEMRQAGAIMEA